MFQGRFFPREEGGTDVRQVWIRVRALEARFHATLGRCGAALAIVDHIGDRGEPLAFTRSLSASGEAGSLVFAYELARQLPGFDAAAWSAQLQSAGSRWGGRDTESSWNAAISGILELDLGHTNESRALIESALLLPDRSLAHHLGREALRSFAGK